MMEIIWKPSRACSQVTFVQSAKPFPSKKGWFLSLVRFPTQRKPNA